jgi:5-methylcytosine-specific restriction endonuclease McrA
MSSNNYQKHRDAQLAQMAANYERNKMERRAKARENYKRNPIPAKQAAARRRVKMHENGVYLVTNKEWARLGASPCFLCGSTELIEIDHIMPIELGGTHSIGNLMPLCRPHNRSKQAKLWIEFRVKKGFI